MKNDLKLVPYEVDYKNDKTSELIRLSYQKIDLLKELEISLFFKAQEKQGILDLRLVIDLKSGKSWAFKMTDKTEAQAFHDFQSRIDRHLTPSRFKTYQGPKSE
jgi:hypothetical protein